MNYRHYRYSKKEYVIYSLEAIAIIIVISAVFYDSVIAAIISFPFVSVFLRFKKIELVEKRKKEMKIHFKEGIQSISSALNAGYSVENALKEATQDLILLYTANANIVCEFEEMTRKIAASQTIEQVFIDFANRSGIEEAKTFAEIFMTAKRSGGDLIGIIRKTVLTISDKIEIEKEIATIMAAKRYEQKIMNIMPIAIVLYIRIGSNGFLNQMYKNIPGISIMSACLGIYLLAFILGEKLVKIEV